MLRHNVIACGVMGSYKGYGQHVTLIRTEYNGKMSYSVYDNHLVINETFESEEQARRFFNSLVPDSEAIPLF